jgi:hypothetical protein
MADRYQDRSYPADDNYDRGDDHHAPGRAESDPLAELARLIGQTDPFANIGGRANQQVQPRSAPQYQPPVEADDAPTAGPPPWMQRAARQEAPAQDYSYDDQPAQDYPSAEHPLRRYAAQHPEPAADYGHPPPFAEVDQPLDPARYDDALFGQLGADGRHGQHDPAYGDDAYAYQDGYDEGAEEPAPKRRGILTTVIMLIALAVVGTGGALAYRSYLGPSRTGEPPIIKADTSSTRIVPATDPNAKVPDRLAAGDGSEKIVPREEAPVDVNANTKAGPRMVFPPLNQNANPPSPSSVAPGNQPPASAGNGTMPNSQPRAIKTFTVRGDQPDSAAVPVSTAPPAAALPPAAAKPPAPARAAVTPRTPPSPTNANASANAPLSLSPQATQDPVQPAPEPRTHVANNAPVPLAPAPAAAPAATGSYLVQVSSQKNEADAQASYRVLQGKFPAVLGSHAAVIKRADLGDKGIYYRAMVGPFGSSEEASQFCGNLKSAGGQCVIQRN